MQLIDNISRLLGGGFKPNRRNGPYLTHTWQDAHNLWLARQRVDL